MAAVFLYNIREREKLVKLKLICYRLGVDCREVAPEDFRHPVGFLVGLEGYTPAEATDEEPFAEEMLLMRDLRGSELNGLLDAMRQARVPVALKAVVTEHNAAWSSSRLHRELQAEHAALQRSSTHSPAQRSLYRKKKK